MPIYDQTFRRYTGERRTRFLWWPIARQTVMPTLKAKNTYLLVGAAVIGVVIFSVILFSAAKVQSGSPQNVKAAQQLLDAGDVPIPFMGSNSDLNSFIFMFAAYPQAFLWLFLCIVRQGGVVSADKKLSALPLYFSRPLVTTDYMIGKLVGLAIFPFAVMSLSVVIVWIQVWAYFYTLPQIIYLTPLLGAALFFIALQALFAAASMAAVSSLTTNARTASVLFIGFWIASTGIAEVLSESTRKATLMMLSPRRALEKIAIVLLHPQSRWVQDRRFNNVSVGPAILCALFFGALFLWTFWRKLRIVEVVK